MPPAAADAGALVAQLREQASWCRRLGSPLYADLLTAGAMNLEAGGVVAAILAGHEDAPRASALSLRLMGGVHRLVLEGRAAALARRYPSAGGAVGGDAWPDFLAVLEEHRTELRTLVESPVQTNEVGRSASLLGGFLHVARMTGLPLRLLEVGTSAGLNLRWDQFRYESHGVAFGDAASALRFVDVFTTARPPLAVAVTVAERAGCDALVLDPTDAETRLTLRSYIWPDQTERLARLDAALGIAARVPARLERADLVEWLPRQLATPAPGQATVVFHSIVMQYVGREQVRRFRETMETAGAAATPTAPLAWLRLEPTPMPDGGLEFRIELTTWPGGESRILAVSSPHGPPVRWLDGS